MIVRRILLLVFLLGIWAQAVSACPETHVAPGLEQKTMEVVASSVSGNVAAVGGEHRCDCPAIAQNVEATVSESSKYLLASYMEGSNAFPNSSNPASVALAVHTRVSSFIARRSGQPPHLLVLPLRL
jgi:hypothetical protein